MLKAGTQVDARGTDSATTPQWEAAIKDDIELVTVLLDAAADINVNCAGVTPLSCATKGGRVDMLRFLLERGANVKDDNGKSMLEYIRDFTKNRKEVEQLLREHGA